MTPDQRAVLAVQEAGGYTDEVPVIAEAIRAALRERDARWGQAARPAMELLMMFPVDAMGFHRAGEVVISLRALLEEAGK